MASTVRGITLPSEGTHADSNYSPHARRGRRLSINALAPVIAVTITMTGFLGAAMRPALGQPSAGAQERTLAPPSSLIAEHALLHTDLANAARLPGSTGAAARQVMALIEPHFAREQRLVFPLLRLLPMLGKGRAESWMTELLPIADRLSAESRLMLQEHVAIRQALDGLATAAWREDHAECAFLAQRFERHARMEEEVFYPAALLVGEYLRLRLPSAPTDSSH